MKTFLLVIFGFLSGIVGGMGMGGGTVLVPLLSFLDIPQKTVQAINLLSFLPMCTLALILHAKNNLISTKNIGWVVFPATVCAVTGAVFAGNTDNNVLKKCFAFFLIAVGVWQLIVAVKFMVEQRKKLIVCYSPVRCLKAAPYFVLNKRRKTKKLRCNNSPHDDCNSKNTPDVN